MVAGCGGAEARRQKALAKGNEYYSAGNYEKARVEFRNALQLTPNDADARYQNGRVLEKLQKYREAVGFYQGALEVRPDFPEARIGLGRLLLFGGVPDRALEVLKPGLEQHPDDAMMLTLRAAVRAQLKDAAGAFEDAERAVRLAPKSEEAVAVLAGLYNGNSRSDKAQALLEQGVQDHPQSAELRFALAQLYASLHENAKAEATLREIIKLQPDEPAHTIRLAQFLTATGQVDAAEQALRGGVAALPRRRELAAALVDFLAAFRGPAAAEAELRALVAAAPADDAEPSFALAQFYERQGSPAKAEELYRAVVTSQGVKGAGLAARNRLAALRLQQDDAAGAQRLIAEVLAASPRDADALVLRGTIALGRGDPKGAIADLRSALRDQPNSGPILRALARAHLQNNEPALAEEALRRAVDAAPADPSNRLDLAGLLIEQGKPEQAKPMLVELAKKRPADLAVQQALFRASAAAKDYVTARGAADAILAAQPQGALGHFFLGLIAEAEGRPELALKEYDLAVAAQPDGVEPIEALTRFLVTSKRAAEAYKRLDLAAARAPRSAVALNLKSELLASERRYPEAQAVAREAIGRAPKWWRPYRTLAFVALAQGDKPGAIAILTDALGKVGEPNLVRGELAEVYAAAGDRARAIAIYEEMQTADPNNLAAANNLAMLLVGPGGDQAQLRRAAAVVAPLADSANPNYLDTYGWVKLKQGDAQAALRALEKASAAQPNSQELRYHLGMAQLAAGQKDNAATSLRLAVGDGARYAGLDDARSTLAGLPGPR